MGHRIHADRKILTFSSLFSLLISSLFRCILFSERKGAVERFIEELRKKDAPVTEFSDNLWLNTVQSVKVETDGSMVFVFKNGTEVKV